MNSAALQPGDTVLLKLGDLWREQLEITWSGTAGAFITFSAYGSGAKPRILGSEPATDWPAVEGHSDIWRSASFINWLQDGINSARLRSGLSLFTLKVTILVCSLVVSLVRLAF